jgi:hypothetical protein
MHSPRWRWKNSPYHPETPCCFVHVDEPSAVCLANLIFPPLYSAFLSSVDLPSTRSRQRTSLSTFASGQAPLATRPITLATRKLVRKYNVEVHDASSVGQILCTRTCHGFWAPMFSVHMYSTYLQQRGRLTPPLPTAVLSNGTSNFTKTTANYLP